MAFAISPKSSGDSIPGLDSSSASKGGPKHLNNRGVQKFSEALISGGGSTKQWNNERIKEFSDKIIRGEESPASTPRSSMNSLLGNSVEEQVDFGMKIFLTSLKNQIPGNETNTDEMVRTLMQMTTTIQQARANKLLEDGNNIQSAMHAISLTKLEGDMVEHPGDTFTFDGTSQEIRYSFAPTAKEVVLNIFNARTKELVQSIVLDPRVTRDSFIWDGKDRTNNTVPKADYKVFLTALDKDRKGVRADISLNSKVTSTYYDRNNLPVLKSGDVEIREITAHKKLPKQYETAFKPLMKSMGINTDASATTTEVNDSV